MMKGLKYMAGALPLVIMGPTIIYSAFGNQENPWFIPVLIIGFLAFFFAIFLLFKGIGTLMKALFD